MKTRLLRGGLLLVFALCPISVFSQGAPAGGSTELYRNGTAVVVSDGGKEWLCLNGYSPGHAGGGYISEKNLGVRLDGRP